MFFYGNSITLTRSIGMTFLGINSLDLMPKRLYCHNYSELPDEYPDYTWYYIEDIVEEPDDPGEAEYLTEDAKEKTVTVSMYGQEIQVIPTTTDDDVSVESFIESNIIVPDGVRVEIMDMSGNILSDGDSVGTKSILTIYDENNTPLIYYAIAVKGDISGDGALALFDAFKILIENLTGKDLDPIDIIARDFNDDGSVTLFDAFKFLIKSLQS